METKRNRITELVNEFTKQTLGTEIPEGLAFSTCFPLSIFLDLHQITTSISCGEASKNSSIVTHCWLTLDHEGLIIDPTIRQFDPTMESTYIGKLSANAITKKYVPLKTSYQDWFASVYNIWAEPLIDKQPRTFKREPAFEDKMNMINIKTATILYSYILKMTAKNECMSLSKCERYFSPIFKFLQDKSKIDKKYMLTLTEKMPKDFHLLFARALQNA